SAPRRSTATPLPYTTLFRSEGWHMARNLLRGQVGLDILAVTAILATVIVGEFWASLVIVLMLSGGEALEDLASVRARRELNALRSEEHTSELQSRENLVCRL